MSEPDAATFARLQDRTLALYYAAVVLMLLGIGVLAVYSYRLGPIVGPGVEQSFGYAVALMFIMGALTIHIVDRMYRVWPLGRRFRPTPPGAVTDRAWSIVVAVLVLVIAGGAIAYILGGLLA